MASLYHVVVLGGCRSLGHQIVKKLFEAGSTDFTVSDVNTSNNTVQGGKYIKVITIFHTVSPSMLDQRNTDQTFYNVNGAKTLLESVRKVGTTKLLVYTSHSSVSHNSQTDLVLATEDALYCSASEQTAYYTQTKAEAEMLMVGANTMHGLLTAAIHACTFFGENDNVMSTQT
ncbi:hypothetical protein HBI23_156550 [Parastagonospora nodorum]|nr:hypothetical protein HBI79_144130 [Parastagonospora nodorum]KAH5412852.1 hypothetical protein HBI47_155030 [Parastagonospora nodorum]KAH5654228.1 hypothetical protein HBI23_156550 [Parastagonospora nodorum]